MVFDDYGISPDQENSSITSSYNTGCEFVASAKKIPLTLDAGDFKFVNPA
jgi:hypothetical protein